MPVCWNWVSVSRRCTGVQLRDWRNGSRASPWGGGGGGLDCDPESITGEIPKFPYFGGVGAWRSCTLTVFPIFMPPTVALANTMVPLSVAGPGFPWRGGGGTPKVLFGHFFPENYKNERNWIHGGGRTRTWRYPLDPSMLSTASRKYN